MHADFTKTGHGRNAGYLLIFPVFLQNTDPDTATYRGLELKTTMINILFVPVPGWKIEITTICSCVRGVLLRYFCQTYSYSTNSRNIISFSDQRASKWIFFVFRRVKLVHEFYSEKRMFRNTLLWYRMARRNRDVSTPWISLRMFPYSTPTHNIANIALAPSCGNTLLFINDRRKCRSRLIIAYCVSNHFRIKSCDVAGDRKENWTCNDSDGRNFFNNNIFQLIDSSR